MLTYSALIDGSTHALLTLSEAHSVIASLSRMIPDALVAVNVNLPNYHENLPFPVTAPVQYVLHTWKFDTRTFVPSPEAVVTDELRVRSRLATAKRDALVTIQRGINIARYPLSTGMLLQETVYLNKKTEAVSFRDRGYPEENIVDYPLVMQYADFAELSLRDAADEIIFKSKLADDTLSKTELLRLKYTSAVRKAMRPEELAVVEKDFVRECFRSRL